MGVLGEAYERQVKILLAGEDRQPTFEEGDEAVRRALNDLEGASLDTPRSDEEVMEFYHLVMLEDMREAAASKSIH